MGPLDYKTLYTLQDEVLKVIFSNENTFYLTGGTCLNRFYIEKRYSDDLDLFSISTSRFSLSLKSIQTNLSNSFSIKQEVAAKDFVRIRVNDILQVDFVNEYAPRVNEPRVLESGIVIDTIPNILANKLTAVIGRDNPKDIFDIYLISKYNNFSWNDIICSAQKKCQFATEDLIARLETFPFDLLKMLRLSDSSFLDLFDEEYPQLVNNIRVKGENKVL